MAQDNYEQIARLYSRLAVAITAKAILNTVGATFTFLTSAYYVREGYGFMDEGERSRAQQTFGWAGLYKRMANSEEKATAALRDRATKIENAVAEYRSGGRPSLFESADASDLQKELVRMSNSVLTIRLFTLIDEAGVVHENATMELEALKRNRRRQKK